jgi:hypothetical protein
MHCILIVGGQMTLGPVPFSHIAAPRRFEGPDERPWVRMDLARLVNLPHDFDGQKTAFDALFDSLRELHIRAGKLYQGTNVQGVSNVVGRFKVYFEPFQGFGGHLE